MLKGYEKAAAILSLLGDELSQKILSNLPEEMAVQIINTSEKLKTPSKDELLSAVSEFNDHMQTPVEAPVSEPEQNIGEQAEQGIAPAVKAPVNKNDPVSVIENASPESLGVALSQERPEIAAYVLSHLPVEKIYDILPNLGNIRNAVETRLVSIKDVPIAKELEDKILKNISERLS
jgi:flagellar motor switch protein FliG